MGIINKVRTFTRTKINYILAATIIILLIINYIHQNQNIPKKIEPKEFNACCAFPCENSGICIPENKGYSCDCSDTGYFGKNCEKIIPTHWLNKLFKFNPIKSCFSLIDNFPKFWKIINSIPLFQHIFVKNLYITTINWGAANYRWATAFDVIATDFLVNSSLSTRSLPPIPKTCSTPMGVRGPKQLPSADELYEKILKRTEFQTCPKGTNILFLTYMQHFASQFDNYDIKDGKQHEIGMNLIDMSHIYGKNEFTRRLLRSFKGGKLKSRIYKGEEYPPYVNDCPGINMYYPGVESTFASKIMPQEQVNPQWALGNPNLSMTPMLFVFSTIWLREHNRICTILASEHKHWHDEQLYQTAKLIITGEVIKITVTEFMQHFIQSRMEILYRPKLLSDIKLQFTASIPQEFSILPPWYVFLPEVLTIESKSYNISTLMFTNNKIVFELGIDKIINAMAKESSGEIMKNNIASIFKYHIKHALEDSRTLRIQSFNNYRRRFGLKPAQIFEDITGNLHSAVILKELYLDVEAVELIIGLMMENKGNGIVPPTMTTLTGAWLVRGLMSHPINSPEWWKPSTFGGEVGMNIIKLASLKKLICLNIRNKCRDVYVSFKVPNQITKNYSINST